MIKRLKHISADQSGVTIVEAIVSALLMVVLAVSLFTALNAAARAGANDRHRGRAFAIAQDDQSRLRSLPVASLTRISQTRDVFDDGVKYTVTSTGSPALDRTATSACDSGNSSADYIKISSTVTWSAIGTHSPVKIESIVAPPNGSLEANRGSLGVSILDSRNAPYPGIAVTGSGAGTFSGTTTSTGCVLFGDLLAGGYTVSAGVSNLVDTDGNAPAPIATSVVGQSSNTLGLQYDKPGKITVTYKTVRPASSTPATGAYNDAVMVYNSGMTAPKQFGTVGTRVNTLTATSLFPFTSPYSVYAGSCTSNNPNTTTYPQSALALATPSPTVPLNNGTASTVIQLPALALTVKSGTNSSSAGSVVNGAKVTVTDQDCLVGSTPVVRTLATGTAGTLDGGAANRDPGLPYGIDYDVCVSGLSSSGTTKKIIRNDVALTSATTPNNLGILYLNSGTAGSC